MSDPGEASGVPKVLLVDDRPDNLLALQAVLEPLDVELVSAGSGGEALAALLAEEFAAVVLDVQMPDMDGFETAQLIKGRERTRLLPIIFLTAISGEPHHHLAGYQAGIYPDPEGFSAAWRLDRRFRPAMDAATRARKWAGWQAAVARVRSAPS